MLSHPFCIIFPPVFSGDPGRGLSSFNIRIELKPLVKPHHLFFFLSISLFPLFALGNSQPRILERPTGQPAAEGFLLPSSTRHTINLDGQWSYSLDGENWHDVAIPSSFDYEGKIMFQRRFSVERELLESMHFKIVALGVNNDAEILINDVFVGRHYGGYTTAEVDIPEGVLQFGPENTIKVISNNTLSASSSVPVRKQVWGWKNYGGILRDIVLLAVPRMWVDRLSVRTKYSVQDNRGDIQCAVTVSTVGAEAMLDSLPERTSKGAPYFALHFALVDLTTGETVSSWQPQAIEPRINQDTRVDAVLTINNPRRWSPEAPELYRLTASLVVVDGKKRTLIDEVSQIVGFRSFEISGDKLLLNGKRITLRGIVWHEDSPRTGASLSYDEMERDIALIKTLGANAIRFIFHPPHPYMVTLCDRYGILATEEIPIWSVPASVLEKDQIRELAAGIAQEMVLRDIHHPSVIAWGLGSEFDSSDPRARSYVQRVAALIRSLDDRPVFFGTTMLQTDQSADLVDFVAIVPSQTDLKSFKLSLAVWKKSYPNKPLIVSRYGKAVEHHNRNGYTDPLSQEAQARFFIHHYEAIRQAGAAGSFINAFADWRGDRPLISLHTPQPYVYPLGLVSVDREKRASFEVVKTLYADQKVGALPSGNFRSSLPVAHVVAGFSVIFVVAYQYNYNRRFREALKRSLLRPYNFFADLRDMRAAAFLHTLTLALAISLTLSVVISGFLYFLRGNHVGDLFLTQLIPSDAANERVAFVVWNLTEGIAILAGVFFALSLVVAVLIKLFSFATRARVTWTHVFSVATWSASPFIFLSPLGMSLFKVLEDHTWFVLALGAVGLVALWVLVRMLRGISVLLDIGAGRTYVVGFLLAIGLMLSVFFYLDSQYLVSDYLAFLINVMRSSV